MANWDKEGGRMQGRQRKSRFPASFSSEVAIPLDRKPATSPTKPPHGGYCGQPSV
jgi:hypothetical protein